MYDFSDHREIKYIESHELMDIYLNGSHYKYLLDIFSFPATQFSLTVSHMDFYTGSHTYTLMVLSDCDTVYTPTGPYLPARMQHYGE